MSEKPKTFQPEGPSVAPKRGKPGIQSKAPKSQPRSLEVKPKAPKSQPRSLEVKPKASKSQPRDLEVKPKVQKPQTKAIRTCGSCQGQVAHQALYCRHCGKPLSADVPPNPYLPAPPKPWRPSRIPRHRPSAPSVSVAPPPLTAEDRTSEALISAAAPHESVTDPTEARPFERGEEPIEQAPHHPAPVEPEPDPLWAPIPEIEARMADLRAMHERLRPMLSRSGGARSRMRSG